MIVRNIWTISIAFSQIYTIDLARKDESNLSNDRLISPSDSVITFYEKLSILQILPSCFSILRRVLALYGVVLFPIQGNLDGVTLEIDEVCYFLFLLKSLLIKENANLKIEYTTV
jgi:hypothetical protein